MVTKPDTKRNKDDNDNDNDNDKSVDVLNNGSTISSQSSHIESSRQSYGSEIMNGEAYEEHDEDDNYDDDVFDFDDLRNSERFEFKVVTITTVIAVALHNFPGMNCNHMCS